MDVWFPDWFLPATTMWGLDDFTAVDSSATTGTTASSELFGTRRWHCRMDFPVLTRGDGTLQLFQALLASFRGRANRVWISDRSYVRRGSFPAAELVQNGRFSNSGGWSATNATLTVLDRMARVQNSGSAGGCASTGALTLTSGAAYIVRAGLYPGKVSAWVAALGTTANTFDLVTSGALTAAGLYVGGGVVSHTTGYLSLYCDTAVAGDFAHFTMASVSRGALVDGANQTGSALAVKALPASTSGTLRVGDMAQIVLPTYGAQLARLVTPLSSDSSGKGYMQFEPALKESPSDGAPIVIQQPMGRFMLLNGDTGVELSPGVYGNASLEFVEA